MKQKQGFALRDVSGKPVLVAEGMENINYSKILAFSETAAFLWEALAGRDFQVEDMAECLLSEYDVSADEALDDSRKLLAQWQEFGLVEG